MSGTPAINITALVFSPDKKVRFFLDYKGRKHEISFETDIKNTHGLLKFSQALAEEIQRINANN